MIIRIFDLIFALSGLIILSPVICILFVAGLLDTGSPIFTQQRLGKAQKPFRLIKFRSMKIGSPEVSTHLAKATSVTKYGKFLRKSKLDEIPQLFNVACGQMSIVGSRPGLPSQAKLSNERAIRGIYNFKPGITGIAQINQIDMSTPRKLARYDQIMAKTLSPCSYLKIIFYTIIGKGLGDKIDQRSQTI